MRLLNFWINEKKRREKFSISGKLTSLVFTNKPLSGEPLQLCAIPGGNLVALVVRAIQLAGADYSMFVLSVKSAAAQERGAVRASG